MGLFGGKLIGPLDIIGIAGFLTFKVEPYGYTNLSPPFSSLSDSSSFVSRYRLAYFPCFYSPDFDSPLATLTNSLFKMPFPMKASFGCKYFANAFLITQSPLTKIPNYSSIALMLVFILPSPPSFMTTRALPPASMYCLTSVSSLAVNGILGAPKSKRLVSAMR